jgi:hypothetical protein
LFMYDTWTYVHECIAHVLGAICFLNMAKWFVGFVQLFLEKHYIPSLIAPYAFNFMIHFKTFSPHQFGVTTEGRCEAMVHDIWWIFNLHLDWVLLKIEMGNALTMTWANHDFSKYG